MSAMLPQDRCTQSDYVRLFADSAEPLHWLCYTLTGDEELSERVLNAALEQSLKGANSVFREWMVSWARRLLIKFCAEIVQPWKSSAAADRYPLLPMTLEMVKREGLDAELRVPSMKLQESLLHLDPLSRFVFVLRAIEGYSRRETSLLLNIDDRICEWTYARAAEAIEEASATQPFYDGMTHGTEYHLAQAGN
jgi:DNA-directed RNA polymerase specialized sigma24 family protein